MTGHRWRPVLLAAVGVVVVWIIAFTAYTVAKNSKMTAEKVKAYAESVNLKDLSPEARAKAIRELADRLNALSAEERQQARFDRAAMTWFREMTEEEKATFVELTMPTGFKQMLTAFEQMPEDRRQKAIADSLRRMREARTRLQAGQGGGDGAGPFNEPPISEELQQRISTIGLKAFYSQSSAQTKAELAPLLEELQRSMEGGRMFRHR